MKLIWVEFYDLLKMYAAAARQNMNHLEGTETEISHIGVSLLISHGRFLFLTVGTLEFDRI